LGPKGDMRCCRILSVIFKTPEMHIPPWYWFSIYYILNSCQPPMSSKQGAGQSHIGLSLRNELKK
jgi:hypothetical protein